MKKGFMLIEVIIALVISSTLAVSLLAFLYQLSLVRSRVDDVIVTSGRAAIIQRQMERDLMGVFVPILADVQITGTGQEKQKEAEKKAPEKKVAKKKEEKPKPVDKFFYGVNQDGKLDTLTFVTSNPMQMYGATEQAKPRPRVARVVYRLVPDKQRKNAYILTRQEGKTLYFDAYKSEAKEIPTYEVINGIKDFSVQYIVAIEKEGGQKGEKKKTEREYKTFKEWKEIKQQKEEGKQLPPLPLLVEIRVILWDSSYEQDILYLFTVPILAEFKPQQKKTQPKKQPPKQLPKQPQKQVQRTGQPQQRGGVRLGQRKQFSQIKKTLVVSS